MTLAFWYWLLIAVWLFWGLALEYRVRATYGRWWWGRPVFLLLLFIILGLRLFPDPFSTLVK